MLWVSAAGNFTFARVEQTASQTLLIHANAKRTLSPPKWQLAPTMLMHATGCVSRSVSLPSLYPRLFWRLKVFPRASLWFKLRGVYFFCLDIRTDRRFRKAMFSQRGYFLTRVTKLSFFAASLGSLRFKLTWKYVTWYALRQRNISHNIHSSSLTE